MGLIHKNVLNAQKYPLIIMRKTQLEGRDTVDTERLVLRVTVEYENLE